MVEGGCRVRHSLFAGVGEEQGGRVGSGFLRPVRASRLDSPLQTLNSERRQRAVHDLFFPRTACLACRPAGKWPWFPCLWLNGSSEMWAERAVARRSKRPTVGFSKPNPKRVRYRLGRWVLICPEHGAVVSAVDCKSSGQIRMLRGPRTGPSARPGRVNDARGLRAHRAASSPAACRICS
jgi:hypothetical protein